VRGDRPQFDVVTGISTGSLMATHAFLGPDFEFTSGSLTFDPVEQTALFERGYQQALDGTAWATQRTPTSTEELIQNIVSPATSFDGNDLQAWLMRDDQ
jgi:hypothetical protein